MSWTLTTSEACLFKAGAGRDTTISGASLSKASDDSEATLALLTRKDWVADYATIKANYKGVLSEYVACDVGTAIISHNMSGYTSRYEAQTMLDILRDKKLQILTELQKDQFKEVMVI